MKALAYLLPVISIILISCGGVTQEESSQPKMDVDVPSNQLSLDKVDFLLAQLTEIDEAGRGEIAVVDIFDMLLLTPNERQQIVNAKNKPITMRCRNHLCSGTESSRSLTFKVTNFSHPSFGTQPTFILSSRIDVKVKVISENEVEICYVNGVNVKKGFFNPAVRWGHAKKISGTDTKVILDVGPMGSYGSRGCP